MSQIYSVRELTGRIKDALERDIPFIWVRGQVSNLSRPSSGHLYFTLKDEEAQLNVVWFRQRQGLRLDFGSGAAIDPLTGEVFDQDENPAQALANGQEVLVGGRIGVYPPRGVYQLMAESVQDVGLGRLHVEFEALKQRFAAKGYFDLARKRPLPRHARRAAVVTAVSGAALRDFLRLAGERGWGAQIRIYPTPVQGEEAPARIVQALDKVARQGWAEVVALIRGGGSLEDLWAFNAESVAEAVYRSPVPVVAGVGHEVDFTLADMIADVRAATPSHAAQLLWPERSVLVQEVDGLELDVRRAMETYLARAEARLTSLARGLSWLSPLSRVEAWEERFRLAGERLQRAMERMVFEAERRVEEAARSVARALGPDVWRGRETAVAQAQERLDRAAAHLAEARAGRLELLAARLNGLDPEAPLRRGYGLVRRHGAKGFLRSVGEVAPGDGLEIFLRDGRIEAETTRVEQRLPEGRDNDA